MKIVLTGGGTGGHVIPNLSLIPYLKNHFNKIYYIGNKNQIEFELVSSCPEITKFYHLKAPKLKRDKFLKNLSLPFLLLKSIFEAKKILKEISPQVVFSKGGFMSVPVCIASKLLKIPVVSHESDLSLGLANKIIYKVCNYLCTSFEKTSLNLPKAVFTGSPIREQLFNGSKQKGWEIVLTQLKKQNNRPNNSNLNNKNLNNLKLNNSKLNLNNSNLNNSNLNNANSNLNLNLNNTNKPVLLITGGSTGAKDLNQIIFDSLPKLTKHFFVVHLVGKDKQNKNLSYPNYTQIEYCKQIEHLFSLADFVVSRAGSNAINELLYLKKPMLLVPLPVKASRGDQIQNANYFASLNIAKVVYQENLTPQTLLENLFDLQKNKNLYLNNMSSLNLQNGNKNITNQILKTIKKQ